MTSFAFEHDVAVEMNLIALELESFEDSWVINSTMPESIMTETCFSSISSKEAMGLSDEVGLLNGF